MQLNGVRFEDLERDPLREMEQTYASLNLPDFGEVRPALVEYIASQRGYRKGEYPQLEKAQRQQVAEEWHRNFEEWGYAM